MNAPAKIAPARDRYIPIVTHHCPGVGARALALRCSLLLIRDQATSSLSRCSDEAAGILTEVQRLATIYAFARIPADELADLRQYLVKLTANASGLEGFAYRLRGGANEGG